MESEVKSESRVAGIVISNAERVVDASKQVTKLEVAQYYHDIVDRILPHVIDRPLAIVRCPQGLSGECFFQKNYSDTLPDELRKVNLGDGDYGFAVENTTGLVALAQFGVLELHPWGSRIDDLDRPDRITFDLDPGPGTSWPQVVEAAKLVKSQLKSIGLESWVKTSGGKGLHVCIPLLPDLEWPTIKSFAHSIARYLEEKHPDRYVSQSSKSKRQGRIFIDYLRNGKGATSVASYSLRARPGSAVSVPLRWSEIGRLTGANEFDIRSTLARSRRMRRDPWEEFLSHPQDLRKCLSDLGKSQP